MKYLTESVLILSGNVHFTEISKITNGSREIVDFTSSGLTHTNMAYSKAKNRYRFGKAYDGLNFGLLEIDWTTNDSPVIFLKALNANGEVVFDYRLNPDNFNNKN